MTDLKTSDISWYATYPKCFISQMYISYLRRAICKISLMKLTFQRITVTLMHTVLNEMKPSGNNLRLLLPIPFSRVFWHTHLPPAFHLIGLADLILSALWCWKNLYLQMHCTLAKTPIVAKTKHSLSKENWPLLQKILLTTRAPLQMSPLC